MKAEKKVKPAAVVPTEAGGVAGKSGTKASDLGLTERRQAVRPLPVPDAVESDGDTDWATFNALIDEKPKT